jgi:hypothetical protein
MILTILTGMSLVSLVCVCYCNRNRNEYISLRLSEQVMDNHDDVIEDSLILWFLTSPPFPFLAGKYARISSLFLFFNFF